jgi:predicted ATP-dependent endonuclease of OLD family
LSLKEIASAENEQVLISSHSTHFVSKNIDDITSIIKVSNTRAKSIVSQINDLDLLNSVERTKK